MAAFWRFKVSQTYFNWLNKALHKTCSATWSYITSIISTSVAHISATNFFAHNDMDMMEIGNGALTLQEQRTHFAAWIFLKSPILLGTDVRTVASQMLEFFLTDLLNGQLSKLSTDQLAIIKNAELLAFHQDGTYGTPAVPFTATTGAPTTSPPEYYSGKSTKGTHVFIINTSNSTATKVFSFANVPGLSTGKYKVHDMWTGKDVSGTFSGNYSVSVAAHDTASLLITAA